MAGEALIHITQDEGERAWRRSREKYILDTQSMRVKAKREGRAAGLAEGLAKGQQKAAMEFARKLKARGRPIAEIIEDTGLTPEEVEIL
jgi:predicted transposase/invertase (TIGR01784 family)